MVDASLEPRVSGLGGVHIVRAAPARRECGSNFDATLVLDVQPARLVLRGDLDLHAGAQLTELASPYATKRMVVDLTDVDFIDSSGLNALLSLHATSASAGGALMVGPMSPVAERLFDLTGTLHYLRRGDC
jgi:anti-anti-sigma factor